VTTPLQLYRRARQLGLTMEAVGQTLRVGPASKVPPEFADELKANKPALLAWLSNPILPGWGTVPPADLPLVTVPPRPTPARRERVIACLLRQRADRPGLLNAWLVRRECAYYERPGRHWDCALHAYAAARDAACWQTSCAETDLWTMLDGFASHHPHAPAGEEKGKSQ